MAINTNTQGPQFMPKDGVGSVWLDPKTKKSWKYTAQGWQEEAGSPQGGKTDTFKVKPEDDEKGFVDALRTGGSNQEQINIALSTRRNIKSKLGQEGQTPVQGAETQVANTANPFEGMTKTQVLRDAFSKGVKDTKELEKIGTLYDTLVGEEAAQIPGDMSILSYEEQQKARGQIKDAVASKAQSLATVQERDGVLGTLGTFESGQDIIDLMEVNDVSTGLWEGLGRQGISVFGVPVIPGSRATGAASPEEDRFAAATTLFTAQFIKSISGTSVTEGERKELMKALPSETKTRQANIEGIKVISKFLTDRYSSSISLDMTPLEPQSGKSDPLGLNSSKPSKENPLGI